MDSEEHRVHFTEGQEEQEHDNNIKVLPSGNGRAIVHCGLLKVRDRLYYVTK